MAFEMAASIAAKTARCRPLAAAALVVAALLSTAVELRAEEGASAPAPASNRAGAIEASAADLDDSGDHASLVFELSTPVEASAFVLADPDRVIIDAAGVRFMIDPEIGKALTPPRRHGDRDGGASVKTLVRQKGLIASFRFGQLEKGRSRIVIDLAGPARIIRVGCDKSDSDGKTRLVIELAKTDRARFAAAAQTARAALAQPAQDRIAERIQSAAGKPIVMIDPGHGGIDRGATVNGLIEKDLVLDFAKALAARLEADGLYQPVLTREDDSFISLSERVRMARDRKVALFVSIHADTLAEATDVSGATVYTVSDRASDAEAARVAEKENQADAAAGLDRSEDASEVSDILFDLTRRETRAYSHVFAHTLLNYWKVAGRLNKNPQRSAGFRVLKAPDVPSVLLELGYLSNEKDDIALSSPQWRDKAVSRMTEAIAAFFSERGSSNFSETVKDTAPVGAISSSSVAAPERAGAPDRDPMIDRAALQALPEESGGAAR